MGLGGYLLWTAVAREVAAKSNDPNFKSIPCHIVSKKYYSRVESDIFMNNPHIAASGESGKFFVLELNNSEINYCKFDNPIKCIQRADKHCIEQMCEYYGILDPDLKCEMFLTDEEVSQVDDITSELNEEFITIEPHSKKDYTPNKEYSFEKWQNVVNNLSKDIQVVQLGNKDLPILDNVYSLVGKTSFRVAAGVLGRSKLFMGTEGGLPHAATAMNTTALVVMTGYQSPVLWSYPQNINIYIGNHGPCGLKIPCDKCHSDVLSHDETEIIQKAREFLNVQ